MYLGAPDWCSMDLWVEYRQTRNVQIRNQLVEQYLPLVRYIAGVVGAGLPPFVDRNELFSYGVFGLMEAIDRYDPDLGTKFETFGSQRIRGSILDELRSLDWAPRSVRSAAREVEVATEELRRKLGREPSDSEIADLMDIEVTMVHRARSDAHASQVDSFAMIIDPDADNSQYREPSRESDHALDAEEGVLRNTLAEAISWLPEIEQRIVWHYYVDGMKLREIARLLDMNGSKVCAMYADIVLLLRERMAVLR